jgi:hypothetical protein
MPVLPRVTIYKAARAVEMCERAVPGRCLPSGN